MNPLSKLKSFSALSAILKDFHVPIALVVFTTTTIYHFYTHADLGPQYVNSLYAFYAFLGGHAYVNRKQDNGDSDAGSST